MKAVAVLVVLCLASVALAQLNAPRPDGLGPKKHEHRGPKKELNGKPFPGLDKSQKDKKEEHKHKEHKHANPESLAKRAIEIFGDADGSAAFKGEKVSEDTIAEVPAKKKAGSHAEKLEKKEKLIGDKLKPSKFADHMNKHKNKLQNKLGKEKLENKLEKKPVGTAHSSSKDEKKNPRIGRPLFNFKDVPAGHDSVVLRKHHFGRKHHKLVSNFVNSHEHVQLILVVDAYVSPLGRKSKKDGDAKKRGHKKSDTDVLSVRHKNLFVFDDHGKQLYPKNGSSQQKSKQEKSEKGSDKDQKKPSLDKPHKSPRTPIGAKPVGAPPGLSF